MNGQYNSIKRCLITHIIYISNLAINIRRMCPQLEKYHYFNCDYNLNIACLMAFLNC